MKADNKLMNMLSKLGVIVLAFGLITACTPQQGEKTADLVYVNWAEGIAYTNLAKVVLEDKMGYEVEITSADVGPAYTAIAQGDADAFMETWLPVLHADYYEQFEDDIVDLGTVYEGTQSGLVVPTYVDIDSISQLNSVRDQFDGEITGIDAGAGIMKTTNNLIEEYNLDFDLIQSSGPAMTSALQRAIDDEEWIVVTGWKPHWKFGRWDLKFLKQDEDKMLWETGNIHIMGRQDLSIEKPELANFLANMELSDPELADLMVAINESDEDNEVVARQWMEENEDVIEEWIPADAQQADM
ncbi:MAG: glycine betaine ABC transporter substrate-binding protein [Gracilimonas sp.]|uniref:glycine betaine ABC transporter substrate-binding protein n=1 Tax=Gracilimonas sp. TaxID=1974203 RepID=UPI0019C63E7A|nr:glycine betaine ABC transporter substrate-binding protein [Gracilimonas sp.]MBD3615101.1 glycine betaine ABC transporter substrate-binding protein [Gracilimonas sp.]